MRHYFLIQAKSMRGAFRKARFLLNVKESLREGARVNGKRVVVQKVGIFSLEELDGALESGVELFHDTEPGFTKLRAKRQVISSSEESKKIRDELKLGKCEKFAVDWGEDFNKD